MDDEPLLLVTYVAFACYCLLAAAVSIIVTPLLLLVFAIRALLALAGVRIPFVERAVSAVKELEDALPEKYALLRPAIYPLMTGLLIAGFLGTAGFIALQVVVFTAAACIALLLVAYRAIRGARLQIA